MECTFTLTYQLPSDDNDNDNDNDNDTDAIMDRLAEAGCDDALVGVGQPGRLALEFVREAPSAHDAIEGAIEDVGRAVPNAHLIEVAFAPA